MDKMPRSHKVTVSVATALLLLATLALACTQQPTTPEPAKAQPTAAPGTPGQAPTSASAPATGLRKGTKIVIAQGTDITSIDPHSTTQQTDLNFYDNVFDRLVTRDRDEKLVPQLATEWKAVNDTTWQFKLRQGVKFHNAEPFNAETVKFNMERILDPKEPTAVRSAFSTVKKVDVVDEYTVTFTTDGPDPLLIARLASVGGYMIPKKQYQDLGAKEFALKGVGTGPYKVVEWKKDERVLLTANLDYWAGPPAIETVIFRPIPENAARVAALVAGEVDIVMNLPPDQAETVKKSGKAQVATSPSASVMAYCFNVSKPPLNNKLVREALNLAVDREAIVKKLYAGFGTVANGPVPSTDFSYDAGRPLYKYDPQRAKALLAQAGYKGEQVLVESASGHIAQDKQLTEAIAQMFQEVGVNAKAQVLEMSVRAEKFRNRQFEGMFLANPYSTLFDPDGMLWRLYAPNGLMDYGWRNPEWDRLMMDARQTLDEKRRFDDYKKATDIFIEDSAWLLIFQPVDLYGVGANVAEWKPRPDQLIRATEIKIK